METGCNQIINVDEVQSGLSTLKIKIWHQLSSTYLWMLFYLYYCKYSFLQIAVIYKGFLTNLNEKN